MVMVTWLTTEVVGLNEERVASVDTASYVTAMAGVIVDLNARKGTGGDAMGDTYHNIEEYVGSSNDDTFIASEGIDDIDAGANDGDDPGPTDGDTISYEESETGVMINLAGAAAADIVASNMDSEDGRDENYAMDDILVGFENATGSGFVDTLAAIEGGSILRGLGGNDTLNGDAGDDTLMGGKGRDTLDGMGGNDRLVGGAGDDIMTGGGDGTDCYY